MLPWQASWPKCKMLQPYRNCWYKGISMVERPSLSTTISMNMILFLGVFLGVMVVAQVNIEIRSGFIYIIGFESLSHPLSHPSTYTVRHCAVLANQGPTFFFIYDLYTSFKLYQVCKARNFISPLSTYLPQPRAMQNNPRVVIISKKKHHALHLIIFKTA